ncbi:hypothetical protein [Streptomyces scopuliridis]|uniref:hypothetical protein n=1 Tax=Streptomyces scopuliridis TaxID=452529 RepID=UPI003421D68E
MEARSCWRLDGDRAYMIGEWRATSGDALVDVFLWVEDRTGEEVVFPNAPSGLAFHGEGAYLPATAEKLGKTQWKEWEIRSGLVSGNRYQVCVSVQPKGSGYGPAIQSPSVKGLQVAFDY